jgi:enamine deaminase RidA (YjgF/YER057c/UK114 family)
VNRFADMDAIYQEYFKAPFPTRNTIGVKELWGGAQVGFDVWAVKSS